MTSRIRTALTAAAVSFALLVSAMPTDAQSRRVIRVSEPVNAAAQNPPELRRSRFSQSAREDRIARLCRNERGGRVYNETRRDANGSFVYCPGRSGK